MAGNTVIVFLQYLTVEQTLFFTTAVAECINAGLSLTVPDSRCVHFALFNDACWGDSGISPLTSALGGPEPVSAVSMATGDTLPQWLETV